MPIVSTYSLKGRVGLVLGLGSFFVSFPSLLFPLPTPSSLKYNLINHRVSSGNGADLLSLTDPQNKTIYEMHQYLDTDGSGTSATCVSATIGSERLQVATAWLRANGKQAILGEYAGGANTVCQSAVADMLGYMGRENAVWLGALWWGGGPWWGDYIYNMEPPSGSAYTGTLPIIMAYA